MTASEPSKWNHQLIFFLVALTFFDTPKVFGQGCAQCNTKTEQLSVDSDTIAVQINQEVQHAMLWYYIGIPALIITVALTIVFRKKIISTFKRWAGK